MPTKREQGYKVTVTFFLPVNTQSVDDTVAKAQAVQTASKGDLSQLVSADVMKFDSRFTSREKPDTAGETEQRPGLREQEADTGGEPGSDQDGSGEQPAVDDPPPAGSPASRARKQTA